MSNAIDELEATEYGFSALIVGYLAKRALDIGSLDLFLALRACTYVVWIVLRIEEQAGTERCARYIKTACAHVDQWLKNHVPLVGRFD